MWLEGRILAVSRLSEAPPDVFLLGNSGRQLTTQSRRREFSFAGQESTESGPLGIRCGPEAADL